MAKSRLSRPGWKLLGGLVLVVIVWTGVPRLFKGSAFFRIRRIEVRGARNLNPEIVVRGLPIRAGQSVFDDLGPVRRTLDSLGGLESYTVGRRLPGTIVITVREAEPVALVMRGGRLRLVGEAATVLPFDPAISAPDLPLVEEADSLVTGLLARVRDTDATFYGRIVSAWRNGDAVVVAVDGQRFWFRPDAGAEVIRAVLTVEQDLEKNGRPWAELDARFAGQVVVRQGAA
jgi:hypothetical protein